MWPMTRWIWINERALNCEKLFNNSFTNCLSAAACETGWLHIFQSTQENNKLDSFNFALTQRRTMETR